jgi:hypothetical protein
VAQGWTRGIFDGLFLFEGIGEVFEEGGGRGFGGVGVEPLFGARPRGDHRNILGRSFLMDRPFGHRAPGGPGPGPGFGLEEGGEDGLGDGVEDGGGIAEGLVEASPRDGRDDGDGRKFFDELREGPAGPLDDGVHGHGFSASLERVRREGKGGGGRRQEAGGRRQEAGGRREEEGGGRREEGGGRGE